MARVVDFVIVGAGFAGSVCAERLASAGFSVMLLEQRPHIGGNAYDRYNEHGILVHEYGPHVFHTNSAEVFNYLSQFTEWRRYEHRVLSHLGGNAYVPFPINRETLRRFDGSEGAARAALIAPYTAKQWGPYAEELDPSVLARVKPRTNDDDRYFLDTYQVMPAKGYTALFERLLRHPRIEVWLGLSWHQARADASLSVVLEKARAVIFTGPIDQYFDYVYGRLPYRSASFECVTMPAVRDFILPAAVVNTPAAAVPHTRIAEFRQLTGQPHPLSTLCYETPCEDQSRPFWPVPTRASQALAEHYRAAGRAHPRVHFCGRLGSYRYLNMDQAVAQALKLSASLTAAPSPETI